MKSESVSRQIVEDKLYFNQMLAKLNPSEREQLLAEKEKEAEEFIKKSGLKIRR